MSRLIRVMVASLVLAACGSQSMPENQPVERAASQGEAAEPSAPVVRFAAVEAGAPDVGGARLHIRESIAEC
jgi:hypothetical protein